MPITHPYRRTCRQFVDGSYANGGKSGYIDHNAYARSPEQYIRAFYVLQKDLEKLFEYIEPDDNNLSCYSYRTLELLLRACIEVEANCKAILVDNGYVKSGDLTMDDYKKIEPTHRLSAYQVRMPVWRGKLAWRKPFDAWGSKKPLKWYQSYNKAKHDRHEAFAEASFENLLDAICGVVAILSAQFFTHDFGLGPSVLAMEGPNDGTELAIGNFFAVKFPVDWPADQRYDFDWQTMKKESNPFKQHAYKA